MGDLQQPEGAGASGDEAHDGRRVPLSGVALRYDTVSKDGFFSVARGAFEDGVAWRVPLRVGSHEVDGLPPCDNREPFDPKNTRRPVGEVFVGATPFGLVYGGEVSVAVARDIVERGCREASVELGAAETRQEGERTVIVKARPVGLALLERGHALLPGTDVRLNGRTLDQWAALAEGR